jgi:putative FmdB family regulatory protein
MPIFEYVCGACDHRFEVVVRGAERPECPACHGRDLQKQLSVFAVSTRGTSGPRPVTPGPCGSCGHPDGPGACAMH